MKLSLLKIAIFAALAVTLLPSAAHAVVGTYNWDPNLTGGTADGGSGVWDATNANWSDIAGSADVTWSPGNSAVFDGAGGGAVILETAESAGNLFFNTGSYTLSGSALTVGGSMSVVAGGGATINSTLTVTNDLDLLGGGSLTIGSKFTPSASGAVNIGSGALIFAQTSTSAINFNNGGLLDGNLVLITTGGARLNFNSLTGSTTAALPSVATYSGSGAIQIQAPNVVLSNASGDYGGAIGAPGGGLQIQLNSSNLPFNKFDVTQATPAFPATNSFATAIGATKNGNFNGYLQINAPISGNSDVVFTSNATTGGGAGVTLLNAPCTYTGATLIEGNGGVTAGYTGGSLILGCGNALPAGTDVEFGDLNGKPSHSPEIDVNGFNQQIGSLSSNAASVNYSATDSFYIANNNVGTLATLTVSGATTPFNAYNGYLVDNTVGSGGTLALVKGGPNALKLTASNTYSGGTTLNGGTLILANTAGSALGFGNLTINGGTLAGDPGSMAGSIFAGAGPHAIAPGGGQGGIGTLIVGGSVNLNSNSSLVLDISGGSSDLLQIGGPLSISSPIDLDFNTSGTLAGPYTLATYASSPGLVPADFDVSGLPPNYALEVTSSQLGIVPVPEPSTLAMLLAGAFGVLLCWRRRR